MDRIHSVDAFIRNEVEAVVAETSDRSIETYLKNAFGQKYQSAMKIKILENIVEDLQAQIEKLRKMNEQSRKV